MSEFTGILKVQSEDSSESRHSLEVFKDREFRRKEEIDYHNIDQIYNRDSLNTESDKKRHLHTDTREQDELVNKYMMKKKPKEYLSSYIGDDYLTKTEKIESGIQSVEYAFFTHGCITDIIIEISTHYPTLQFHYHGYDEDHVIDDKLIIKNGEETWIYKHESICFTVNDNAGFNNFRDFCYDHENELLEMGMDLDLVFNPKLDYVWKKSESLYWDEISFDCSYEKVKGQCLELGFGSNLTIKRQFKDQY